MATFLLGDCLELMRSLPDKSVDCFICDLPYGCLAQEKGATPFGRNVKGPSNSGCSWDVKIDLTAFWIEVKRLCKDTHTPVLMFCNTKFGNDLINSNPSWFRYDLVWDKGRGVSFLLANKMPMKSHEMIYVFSKAGAYYKRIDEDAPGKKAYKFERSTSCLPKTTSMAFTATSGVMKSNMPEDKKCSVTILQAPSLATGFKKANHPTQKPEELYRWLLSRYCPDGGTVLDPTAGSFNACFVARELGLKAIGMEKDRGFFYKAVARLLAARQNVIQHV